MLWLGIWLRVVQIRRLEKAAETKHAQDLDRVRAEVAAHERASYEEQLALLAQERQEVLSRYPFHHGVPPSQQPMLTVRVAVWQVFR